MEHVRLARLEQFGERRLETGSLYKLVLCVSALGWRPFTWLGTQAWSRRPGLAQGFFTPSSYQGAPLKMAEAFALLDGVSPVLFSSAPAPGRSCGCIGPCAPSARRRCARWQRV